MPTKDSSETSNPWGIFEPPITTMEALLPIKSPVLQEMYAHARRQWWFECHRVYRLLIEAAQYGPSVTGSNVSRAADNLVHYEAALDAIRSADLQLSRAR